MILYFLLPYVFLYRSFLLTELRGFEVKPGRSASELGGLTTPPQTRDKYNPDPNPNRSALDKPV